ncbi:flagellar filament capping protein FliD [Paenibacillus thalictri]|nr:flagellar filament capping protein FliD [Paenibacillus thalictri]
MANAWQVLSAYQTNNRYFLVDSFRRSRAAAAAASPETKQPVNYPLARYAFNQFMQTAAFSTASLLQSAKSVQQSADQISTNSSALFKRKADTSDSTSVSVKADTAAPLGNWKVKVDSIAQSQKNTGLQFKQDDPTSLAQKTHQFTLTAGGKTTSLSVSIYDWDTNEQVLGKVKNAINGANLGVHANLIQQKLSGTLQLELTGDATGKDHGFTLADTEGSVVTDLGLSNVTREASDAVYSINGRSEQSSDTNEITLSQGKLHIALKSASSEEINVSVKPDSSEIIKQVQSLLQGYNGFQSAAAKNAGLLNSAMLQGWQRSLNDANMDRLGIVKQADGTLKLDEAKLTDHFERDAAGVIRSLTGLSGVATGLGQAAERLQALPPEALLNKGSSQYKSFTNYGFAGALQSYLPVPMTGLLFNGYF